jgi:hypothetical protein
MRTVQQAFRLALAAGLLVGAIKVPVPAAHAAEPVQPATNAPAAPEAPPAQPPAATPKAAQEVTPDQMKGVSFEGLTEAQKTLVFSILGGNRCDCGCGMTLATCRAKDTTCNRSLGLATQVIDLVKQGKSRDEIVKVALSPPSKYVQFDLPAGESPSVGPADATVTILYYLDHQ